MSAPNDGGPAFPCEGGDFSGLHPAYGMTLRDYFAGQALIGRLAHPETHLDASLLVACMAQGPWAIADAMIAARQRTEGTT